MLDLYDYGIICLAAAAAGMVNAIAGGGTLITFPILMAVGIPPVSANVTNTIALTPGYLSGTMAQSGDLRGQADHLKITLPAGILGGLIGGYILLNTGEKVFSFLIPYLILLASLLLAVQNPVKNWIKRFEHKKQGSTWMVAIPVGLASVYGGYFGAGLSVILLSALGLFLDDNLTRLNAQKQAISFAVNIAASVYFIFSGKVFWLVALVMAFGALAGGALGGKLAGIIKPALLRWLVVSIGCIIGMMYLFKN